jgi:hypothetical protein
MVSVFRRKIRRAADQPLQVVRSRLLGAKLAEADLKMLDARVTCYEGRVSEATKLYDSITDSLRLPASRVQR